MANSSAVSILDSNSSAKTVSTIDAMFSVAGTPSSVNVLTVQPSTAGFTVYESTIYTNNIFTVFASSAGTNATLVSNSAVVLFGAHFYNNAATARFVKLYNSSVAPTPGSSVILFTVGISPGAVRDVVFNGATSSKGVGYTITGGITSTDTTSVAIDDVHGVIEYR